MPILIGTLLILAAFGVGRLTAPAQPGGLTPAALGTVASKGLAAGKAERQIAVRLTSEPVVSNATPLVPPIDVPGAQIDGLPRYPDARRVEYRQRVEDNLIVTEVEYVTTADFESIHNHYRAVFSNEGWLVADLTFYQGEWTFLVVNGSREAIVEVEARGPLVEVEIEHSEPLDNPILIPSTATPLPLNAGDQDDDDDGAAPDRGAAAAGAVGAGAAAIQGATAPDDNGGQGARAGGNDAAGDDGGDGDDRDGDDRDDDGNGESDDSDDDRDGDDGDSGDDGNGDDDDSTGDGGDDGNGDDDGDDGDDDDGDEGDGGDDESDDDDGDDGDDDDDD